MSIKEYPAVLEMEFEFTGPNQIMNLFLYSSK